jgi:hypothetical protein
MFFEAFIHRNAGSAITAGQSVISGIIEDKE